MHLEPAVFAERAFARATYFAKNVTSFFDINAILPETSHYTSDGVIGFNFWDNATFYR
jgi:hypothetical protein